MAPPVRTAFGEAKHASEEKTSFRSPHLSFDSWEGESHAPFSKEGQDIRSRRFQGRPILRPNGEGATQRGVGKRERSNSGHSGRGRFLWRRRTCWPATTNVDRNRSDRLRPAAHRAEDDDAHHGRGAKIVSLVCQILAEAKHPISG